jgi:hypothetical protein
VKIANKIGVEVLVKVVVYGYALCTFSSLHFKVL